MSNYQQIKTEVTSYLRARTPLIIIETSERDRAERMLAAISSELSTEIYYYTETTQVTYLGGPNTRLDVSSDPLGYISELFQKKRKVKEKLSSATGTRSKSVRILFTAEKSSTFSTPPSAEIPP